MHQFHQSSCHLLSSLGAAAYFHTRGHSLQEATIGGVISEMGWWQLATRGLGLRIAMIGTLTATQWAIYDSFKVYVGL